MCPKEAEYAVIDDDETMRDLYNQRLTRFGHHNAGNAGSREEAFALAEQLKGKKIDVVIIDGDLKSPDITEEEQHAGYDGKEVALVFRKAFPNATLIGCREGAEFQGVDVFIPKSNWRDALPAAVLNAK